MKRIIITQKLNSTIDENGNLVTEEFDLPKSGSIINDDYILKELSYSVDNDQILLIKLCIPKPAKTKPKDMSRMKILGK